MRPRDLISSAYLEEQERLHADPRGYGGKGSKWKDAVLQIAANYNASSILDYGCGQGTLATALRGAGNAVIRVDEYDPAIKAKSGIPLFADMVTCTDVLEHVEPEYLANVLAHIRMLARKVVFVVISTCDTAKTLSDGRNAHLIIQPGDWWREQLGQAGFTVLPAPDVARKRLDKEWVGVLLP